MEIIKRLEKSGYRIIGNHSAVKICHWCKQAIREKGVCYKQTFYGIKSHRCMQITPAMFQCTQQCIFCWRDIRITQLKFNNIDDPKFILENCIKQHRNLLSGFGSYKNVKYYESLYPKHVAISLAGEPTMYPKINELIEEILNRKMTAFLVSNGTLPDVIEHLTEPTQFYITLSAPNKHIHTKTCNPLLKDAWKRLQKSLRLMNRFDCNTVIRLTLIKNINLVLPKEYANIIDNASPDFVEVKAFMSVGYSRRRLPYASMPLHTEIKKFAEEIEKHSSFNIVNEQSESRVVLLKR